MKRLIAILDLFVFYIKEVLKSNIVVARDVLFRPKSLTPGIVTLSTRELKDSQAFAMANLITMTPGTLTIDVSPDNRRIKIHTLRSEESDALQEYVTNELERRVINAI